MKNIIKDFMTEGKAAGHHSKIIGAALADYIFENYSYVSNTECGMEEVCVEAIYNQPNNPDYVYNQILRNFTFR